MCEGFEGGGVLVLLSPLAKPHVVVSEGRQTLERTEHA